MLMQLCRDFHDESEALYEALAPCPDALFPRPTQFRGWTVAEVIGHLHAWNGNVLQALQDPDAFHRLRDGLMAHLASGRPLREFDAQTLQGLHGRKLLDQWRQLCGRLAEAFAGVDPKRRLPWVGPDMSARSALSARLMETWAHGQEIYDLLGIERVDTDRIRHIAHMGVNTFGWSFTNRGLAVPGQPPQLLLQAPSGALWEWHGGSTGGRIEGSATAFCQVVTQVRAIADTQLQVSGDAARRWMAIAQCFAGPPQDPPARGSRFRQSG